ncbi:MAG: protein translocase subunit SecF, partial [Candidatus Cybelea sp.]
MLFRRLNWNIVGWFRIVSTISYLIIALGFGAMIYNGFKGGNGFQPSHMLRLGLSFTGGTDIAVQFTQPATADKVKAALAGLGMTEESVTTAGTDGKGFVIQTQTAYANDSAPVWNALNTVAPVDRAASQITAVGPSLGREYLTRAIWALIIALSIQFIYIAFRFGWNYIFGLVTVIALVRDAAMMIGIYALADRRADDAFLAAVLTVIGYSVMDTIVILDRIRENTRLMAGAPYATIVNESIKQTMTRSFNTLATVIITLVALLALGGASLKNFAFALLVGICSGGYHSIFFSAPLVLGYRKRQLEAAAKRRHAGLAQDRTVTARSRSEAASLASRSGVAREDIVAARRERRQKA